MKATTSVQQQHRNQLRDELPWIWLYEFTVPSNPRTRFRLTNYTSAVNWDTTTPGTPLVWSPFPIAHSAIMQTAEGDLPTIQVAVSNVSREVGAIVELYGGLEGEEVILRLVHVAELSNTQAKLEERAKIISCKATHETVTFTIAAANLYRQLFPTNRYTCNDCRWQYGGSECGYIIPAAPGDTIGTGFSTCNKTLGACRDRGLDEVARSLASQHPMRFGGWRGIPRQSRAG